MAKPTAPLLSFGASGSLAQSLVYSKWKGRPYVRRHVVPSNPQSTAQTLTRDIFRNLNSVWKLAGTGVVSAWDRFASGQVKTGRNAFVGQNLAALRGQTDLANWIWSPGAKGGLPVGGVVFTPGANQCQVDITAPALPTGWAITAAWAASILDAAPESMTEYTSVEGMDAAAAYSITLTGLTTGDNAVGAWFEYTKADGSTAYGASTVSLETIT